MDCSSACLARQAPVISRMTTGTVPPGSLASRGKDASPHANRGIAAFHTAGIGKDAPLESTPAVAAARTTAGTPGPWTTTGLHGAFQVSRASPNINFPDHHHLQHTLRSLRTPAQCVRLAFATDATEENRHCAQEDGMPEVPKQAKTGMYPCPERLLSEQSLTECPRLTVRRDSPRVPGMRSTRRSLQWIREPHQVQRRLRPDR